MASIETIVRLLTLNASTFRTQIPTDHEAVRDVARLWLAVLHPFDDEEVLREAVNQLATSKWPLTPASIAMPLTRARLELPPWEEAYSEVRAAIQRADGSLSAMKPGPMRSCGLRMSTAFRNATTVNESQLRREFRDSYEKACLAHIADARMPGGVFEAPRDLLALPSPATQMRKIGR